MRFCATNVTRYFKNTVSLARILDEILKKSSIAGLFLLFLPISQTRERE